MSDEVPDDDALNARHAEKMRKHKAARDKIMAFLVLEPTRSLHAWAALHNLASIRVLEKCGFNTVINENSHHPDAVPEIFMRLDSTE